MSNIHLDDVMDAAEQNSFWDIRGKAIQAYALVEQSLCHLMSQCGEMPREVANAIFYKVTSSRARDKVLDRLLKRKFGSKYSVFFNSFVKLLEQVTEKRNSVVHWVAVTLVSGKTDGFAGLKLVPPGVDPMSNPATITVTDLIDFMNKCDILSRTCNAFTNHLFPHPNAPIDAAMRQTWEDEFQKAFTYPPPDTHPISLNYVRPGTQPPAIPPKARLGMSNEFWFVD